LASANDTARYHGVNDQREADGSRLVFVGEANGSSDIFAMDPDGRNVVQVTDDAAFDTFPIWSRDGQTILFLSHDG